MKSSCALLLALATLLIVPAWADGVPRHHRHVYHHIYRYHLPAGRHVIEGRNPPGSRSFLINGAWYTATSDRCNHWVNGEPIRLISGDWHGACQIAVFYNLARHMSCTMVCPLAR